MVPFSRFIFYTCFLSVTLFFSCKKPNIEEIPSYVSIDSLFVTSNFLNEGTASHEITDAWVYCENKLIGAFEIAGNKPTHIPILREGKDTLFIYPGIRMNGMSGTRIAYPFYNFIKIPVDLKREVVSNNLKVLPTTYLDENAIKFAWSENFESGSISLDSLNGSNVRMRKTSDPNLKFSYADEPNSFSGLVEITNDSTFFGCMTHNSIPLPINENKPIFLELNYRTNNPFTVGLVSLKTSVLATIPIISINPSTSWKKIYINLTPTVLSDRSSTYKVYFAAKKALNVAKAEILFDNIKLVYKK